MKDSVFRERHSHVATALVVSVPKERNCVILQMQVHSYISENLYSRHSRLATRKRVTHYHLFVGRKIFNITHYLSLRESTVVGQSTNSVYPPLPCWRPSFFSSNNKHSVIGEVEINQSESVKSYTFQFGTW